MDEEALQQWAHQQELEHEEYEHDEMLRRLDAHAEEFNNWLNWLSERGIAA